MDTVRKIKNASINLFVKNGFHATPTSLIAKEAKVANGTLFHYFPTKETLINTLFDETYHEFFKTSTMRANEAHSVRNKLQYMWEDTISWGRVYPKKFMFLQQFLHSPFITAEIEESIEEQKSFYLGIFKEGQEDGELIKLPPEFLFNQFNLQSYGVIVHLLRHTEENVDLEMFTTLSFQMFWKGICKKL